MIRVLIADDEAMIRVGVRTILATDPGLEVVADAADGREAVELALRYRPDIACSTSGCPASTDWPPPRSSAEWHRAPR